VAFAPSWQVRVYAVCAYPVHGLHREFTTAAWTVSDACPPPQLYGTGAALNTGHPSRTLHKMVPNAGAPVTSTATANQPAGAPLPSVTAFAICGPGPNVPTVVAPVVPVSTAVCPAGTQVHGTGGEAVNAPPDVVIEGIVPDAALTQVTVRAKRIGNQPWAARAYAVCAP
jgi:hypothetical protein